MRLYNPMEKCEISLGGNNVWILLEPLTYIILLFFLAITAPLQACQASLKHNSIIIIGVASRFDRYEVDAQNTWQHIVLCSSELCCLAQTHRGVTRGRRDLSLLSEACTPFDCKYPLTIRHP